MKNFRKWMLTGIAMIMLGAMLAGCGKDATFDGSKTGDADRFDIEFEVLNTTYSHELVMSAGESIDVSVTSDSGKISISIAKGDEDPVYRGNDVVTSDFNVGIKEAGTYKVSVTGEKAKGHVVFTRHAD